MKMKNVPPPTPSTRSSAGRYEMARAKAAAISTRVFGLVPLPNGQKLPTMREDVFRAALAATKKSR